MWPSLFGLILFQVNLLQADGIMASDNKRKRDKISQNTPRQK